MFIKVKLQSESAIILVKLKVQTLNDSECLRLLSKGLHEVNRQREYDGTVSLGSDAVQRLQISELQSRA